MIIGKTGSRTNKTIASSGAIDSFELTIACSLEPLLDLLSSSNIT
jgi:hypothetical protein